MLRLSLPDESLISAPSNDVAAQSRAGVGDTPPRLDDARQGGAADRLAAAAAARRRSRSNRLPLTWVGINAVEIDQRERWPGACSGVSTGAADQVFQLPQGSVDPETLQIEVEEPGRGYQPW